MLSQHRRGRLASTSDWALLPHAVPRCIHVQHKLRKRPCRTNLPKPATRSHWPIACSRNEGVLDAFGHVSMRHPGDPGRYLLSRSRSPALHRAGRHPRVHARFRAGQAADRRELRRTGDPRLHLSGAAGCDGGGPSPRAGGAAVLHSRGADCAGLPPRRGRRRDRAVLEPARRVRRYQHAGGEAGGGAVARPRARAACGRAAEQSRRGGGRARSAGTGLALRSSCARTPTISSRRISSARS